MGLPAELVAKAKKEGLVYLAADKVLLTRGDHPDDPTRGDYILFWSIDDRASSIDDEAHEIPLSGDEIEHDWNDDGVSPHQVVVTKADLEKYGDGWTELGVSALAGTVPLAADSAIAMGLDDRGNLRISFGPHNGPTPD